jgi:NADH-quinone oxidoreductase subunit D
MVLNMGPQHPSTHGVLRLVLEVDGETILTCSPEIGFLHTGIEKQAEAHTWQQAITDTDRMDYLSPLTNNMGYVLAAERLLGIEVPPRCAYIRVIFCELSRIASHLVWLGTSALDLGAMSVFFYAFQAREAILDMYEMTAGVRMNPSYFRVGGLMADLPPGLLDKLNAFLDELPRWMAQYRSLLDHNPIFVERLQGVGVLPGADALALGVTGPALRASGVDYDVRKAYPYSGYEAFQFDVPVRQEGDCYARYLVRMDEIEQAARILRQAVDGLPEGPWRVLDRKVSLPPREELGHSMEALIHHFKLVSEGFHVPEGAVYQAVESPRGELGYYMVADGGNRPYRMRVRGPSFYNTQALSVLLPGCLLADAVAVIGSIDMVMGEVDR